MAQLVALMFVIVMAQTFDFDLSGARAVFGCDVGLRLGLQI